MVTAPLMVVVYDWVFLGLPLREQLRRRWRLYTGLLCTYALLAPTLFGPVTDADASVGYGVKSTTPLDYAMTQPGAILHYLRLTFWPDRLCLDYWDWPHAAALSDWLPQTAVILVLVVGTVIGLWRRSWAGFVGAWFFGILALTSSFVPIADKVFEHRMYLPLLSLVVLSVVALAAVLRFFAPGVQVGRIQRVVGMGLMLTVVAVLTACTIRRNVDYSSAERMWRDVIAKRPANPRGYVSLGAPLLDAGRLDEAAEAFRTTLRLYPGDSTSHRNLGVVLAKQGKLDDAIAQFRAAIISRPGYASAHHQLGLALLRLDRHADAAGHLQRAVEQESGNGSYRFALAFALRETGQADAADRERRLAIAREPGWPRFTGRQAFELLASKSRRDSDIQEALLLARMAVFAQETPDAVTLHALAAAWSAKRSTAEAKRVAQLALARAREQGDDDLAIYLARRFALQPGR